MNRQPVFERIISFTIGSVVPQQSGKSRIGLLAVLATVPLFLSACQAETLFRSNFDSTPVGSFPAAAQGVGKGAVDGLAGSVDIAIVPPLQVHWARISRAASDSPVSGFQGQFDRFGGKGEYTFTTTLQIPAGTGVATVQCEPWGQAVGTLTSFLHVDFLQNNTVRVDDSSTKVFGSFPRGEPFILQIRLKIGESSGTANISLSGAAASGDATFNLEPALFLLARQFGGIRIWLGAQTIGSVNATNIVVTRN